MRVPACLLAVAFLYGCGALSPITSDGLVKVIEAAEPAMQRMIAAQAKTDAADGQPVKFFMFFVINVARRNFPGLHLGGTKETYVIVINEAAEMKERRKP